MKEVKKVAVNNVKFLDEASIKFSKSRGIKKQGLATVVTVALLAGSGLFAGTTLAEPAITPSIASSATTATTILGIKTLLNQVIDSAANRADYVIFSAATNMLIAIESWEKANSNLLEKAFTGLNQSQQTFFADVQRMTRQLSNNVSISLDKAESLLNEVHNVTAQLGPLSDEYPIVSSFKPMYITQKQIADGLDFIVNGAVFKHATPSLTINGKTIVPSGNTSNRLHFTLENMKIDRVEKPTKAYAELTLYKKSEAWDSWLTNQVEPVVYRLPFIVMPEVIGTYNIEYTYTEKVKKTQTKEREFHHSGKSGSVILNQGVSTNDRNIENIRLVKEWGASSGQKIHSQNSKGFSVMINVSPQNKPFQGYPPGYRHAIYQWDESWFEFNNRKATKSGVILWNEDLQLKLDDRSTEFNLTIIGPDGQKHIFISTGIKGIFDVKYNPLTKQIVLVNTLKS